MGHKHSVYDSDAHFQIDPTTRTIKNVSENKTTLIQFDHNSERFTFEIPRNVEGHDMTLCNRVEVHYLNVDASKNTNVGVYEVTDLQACTDDENIVIFSWLISQNATKLVGSLNFLIRFACINDDGTVGYVWNTAIHKGIAVSDGIYNSEIIIEQYADVLAQLEQRLASRIASVTLLASEWTGADSLYSQVVAVDGVTENSQVDLTPSVEQLAIFYNKDVTFVTENEDGVVTVYAIGQKPENDYTIQVTITEVYL